MQNPVIINIFVGICIILLFIYCIGFWYRYKKNKKNLGKFIISIIIIFILILADVCWNLAINYRLLPLILAL